MMIIKGAAGWLGIFGIYVDMITDPLVNQVFFGVAL
jgi:hypothetical protein